MLDKLSGKADELGQGGFVLSNYYLAWNKAIFETIFTLENDGQPVYLDLDEEVLAKLLKHPALPAGSTIEDLILAVRDTLELSETQLKIFRPINLALREWTSRFNNSHETAGAPPILPLLAVTVLAAENMGSGDHAANAYYLHLFELLDVKDDQAKSSLENGYRRVAEYYWDVLNRWLSISGGIHGSKSAFSISHRYIGLPISQALVRDLDRKKLPRMFTTLALTPGSHLDPREMEQLFNLWVQREDSHVSNGLKNLWTKDSARQRISEVLCGELQNWDGTYTLTAPGADEEEKATVSIGSSSARLTLQITRFPSNSATWGLGLSTGMEDLKSIWFDEFPNNFFTTSQNRKGFHVLEGATQQVMRAVIPSVVELSSEDGAEFRRVPKTLVALQFDSEVQKFVEVEQISLGQDLVLLVQNVPAFQAKLTQFLGKNARPGWKAWATNSTVPEKWTLVEGVQILSVETNEQMSKGLEALVPRTAGSQLILSGGVKIPGNAHKTAWLRNYAPEIRALSQTEGTISVELSKAEWKEDSLSYDILSKWESEIGSVFASTMELDLPSGDYKVSLFEKAKIVQVREFQVVDDTRYNPLAIRQRVPLNHSMQTGISDLYFASEEAVESGFEGFAASKKFVTGALGEPGDLNFPVWEIDDDVKSEEESAEIEFAEELPQCYGTGAHYWEEDNICKGYSPFVLGTCRYCKRKIMMACSSREAVSALKKLESERRNIANLREASKLDAVEEPIILEKTDWNAVIALVIYAVHGTYSSLCSAITPLSSKNLSPEKIVEMMYLMGLIELSADELGRPKTWAIVSKQAIRDEDTSSTTLAGAWDRYSLALVEASAKRLGLEFSLTQDGLGFGEIGTSDQEILTKLFRQSKLEVQICQSTDLADALPPLSKLIEETQRSNLPGHETFEKFDLNSGKWVKQDGFLTSGALRLKTKLGIRYFYVSPKDLSLSRGISCSATMAKYIAANEGHASILWQGKDQTFVYAPFGAIPPGLYARALISFGLIQPKAVNYKGPGSKDGGQFAMKLGPHHETVIKQIIAKLAN